MMCITDNNQIPTFFLN